MSAHFSFRTALFAAAVLIFGAPATLHAQTQRKAVPKSTSKPPARSSSNTADRNVRPVSNAEGGEGKAARPAAQQLRVKPLSKELKQLLVDWERESAKIKTLVGEHQRIVYNSVFETEKWAKGKLYYEAPDKGRIDLEGEEPKAGVTSRKVNEKTGQPYRIEADQETRWICTGNEIVNINDSEKQFEAFPLPEELRGANIIHGPLPFLFGMKAEEAERRFEIDFYKEDDPKKNNAQVVWLTAKPRQGADKENFQKATIILDRKRFLPFAVKLLDPSGNLETVYTFKELHVNQRNLIPPIFRNDPFEPKLNGYKFIQPRAATPEEIERSARDTAPRSNVRQTSGSSSRTANGSPPQPPRPRTANAGGTNSPAPRAKK